MSDNGGPLRIGVSTCLLGENVRFDGGHKRDGFLLGLLGPYVEWVPVCPEVEMGMSIPREPIQLERKSGQIRLVAVKSRTDYTTGMKTWAHKRLRELAREDLSGYILKSKSPSCGLERVKVYGHNGVPSASGRGLFAEALAERFGNLPVEEEGRLHDPKLRENFVECVFAYHRLHALFRPRWTLRALIGFHARHKLLLMAHSPKHYRGLGRLVADASGLARRELRQQYEDRFMAAMRTPATPGKHANVLQHILGYLSGDLDPARRQELVEVIEDFRRRLAPLVVPVTLLRHYVRHFQIEYLERQYYLDPHPKELMLRNHV